MPRPAEVTVAACEYRPFVIVLNPAVKAKMADEDDIVVGSSKMMLKDPVRIRLGPTVLTAQLAYMRITLPIRSTKCPHVQCFDAYWWLESNVNTPQFLCPLCTKELKWDELFIDG